MRNVQHDTVDKHQACVEDVKECFMPLKVPGVALPNLNAPVNISDQDERGAGVQ